jgi:hypothetical protein
MSDLDNSIVVEEEFEEDPEFDDKEGNIYDVSEMSRADGNYSDDDMSVMSYCTTNQDKYFIPPDADLDDVVNKLMLKKSKQVQKMEQQ